MQTNTNKLYLINTKIKMRKPSTIAVDPNVLNNARFNCGDRFFRLAVDCSRCHALRNADDRYVEFKLMNG